MKIGKLSKHAEWLSLIEISGPFLSLSMLDMAFPQGLEAVETRRRQKLRAAYEEWREAVDQEDRLLPELHREWVRLVLTEMLEYDQESLVHADDWPDELPGVSSQEHAGTFKPDWIVRSPADGKPRLFIAVLPPDTDFESVQRGDGWPVSLQERMTLLCRAHGVRVGLLTDGERWMLVNAPVGSTSSQASWYARLWFQEPITLKAFQSLLGVRRCFGPAEETLESLLDESLKHNEEVTDTLGEQVRRAVEVLVQCLDKADEDRNRELLREVKPAELYEAGLTVMMRLVFILCAEERGLLLLGDSVYDRCYAVSTLRGQLAEEADRHGPEVLERRHDAWARLLAVFRAVFGGIEHESLRMPALGGSLFDPDRFPFLEGRAKGSSWRDTSAAPLPIDNRTVLLLLNSLQILEQSGGALLLSYRALDVEQIGHVYEGLLEHTVARVPRVTLGLLGTQKAKSPNVALAELESARLDGEEATLELIAKITQKSEPAIRNALSKPVDDSLFVRVLSVCSGDAALAERIQPFANLLRTDSWDDPIVYRDNSFMVTLGVDRRETGTHYTPKSLTESIVTTTLEPVVYVGPAEGKPREEWKLKLSSEILDLKVCDPAMGSGAFLVQACRYLGEKLVEAWLHEEAAGKAITVDGEALDQLGAEEPLPSQLDERLTIARRLVSERCLYGVDINPLAVELAKLSIWLVTLAKCRPFGFLDHNLRSGDSLLGIHRLEQLTQLRMDTESGRQYQLRIFGQNVETAVNEAIELRKRLRATTIRDIKDVEAMARLDREARRKLESVELIADAMIGEALRCGGNAQALDTELDTLATMAGDFLGGNEKMGEQIACQARANLVVDMPAGKPTRRPFHWALEFPEVITMQSGFDGIIGNPPFIYGKNVSRQLGHSYNQLLCTKNSKASKNVDLSAHFLFNSFLLLRRHGALGLVSTSSISEGETRTAGLHVCQEMGGSIFSADVRLRWPGKANVLVSPVHVYKGRWESPCRINGKPCRSISSYLTESADRTDEWIVKPLAENEGIASRGVVPNGKGFILDKSYAEQIIRNDPKNADVIMPYLVGQDLNSDPEQKPQRYIINFWDWPKSKAEQYEIPFEILESTVKTYRETEINESKTRVRENWWLYEASGKDMFQQLGVCKFLGKNKVQDKNLKRAIAIARVSKTGAFALVNPKAVFAEVTVFATEELTLFGVLQSSIHLSFAWEKAGKMKNDLRYSPSLCFLPFPLPRVEEMKKHFESLVLQFSEGRSEFMRQKHIGLTDFYKKFHSHNENSADICSLREQQQKIDELVAKSYGWQDVELDHGFHSVDYLPENDRVRFTISEPARNEVLQRLTELNRQRYEKEAKRGLHKSSHPKGSIKRANKKADHTQEPDLFYVAPAARESAQAIIDYLSTATDWLAKEDILTGSGIPSNQWQATINQLLAEGLVERQGERRGARYRAVKNRGNR